MRYAKIILSVATSLCVFVNAEASFEWALDRFELSGDVILVDEFNDGIVGAPLPDSIGMTAEQGGFRIFSDAGAAPFTEPFSLAGFTFNNDTIIASTAFIFNTAAGSTAATATWRPDIADVATRGFGSGYGIMLSTAANLHILGVLADGAGSAFVTYRSGSTVFGRDLIDAVGSSVVLELRLDQATDVVSARYSPNGDVEANFIDFATWDEVLASPDAVNYDPFGFAFAGAFGQLTVPLPASVLLMLSGLAGLGAWRTRVRCVA